MTIKQAESVTCLWIPQLQTDDSRIRSKVAHHMVEIYLLFSWVQFPRKTVAISVWNIGRARWRRLQMYAISHTWHSLRNKRQGEKHLNRPFSTPTNLIEKPRWFPRVPEWQMRPNIVLISTFMESQSPLCPVVWFPLHYRL